MAGQVLAADVGVPSLIRFRQRLARAVPETEPAIGAALLIMVGIGGVLASRYAWFPTSAFILPLVVAGATVGARWFIALTFELVVCLALVLAQIGVDQRRAVTVVVLGFSALILVVVNYSRRLGGRYSLGETMLIDLRDRLAVQSALPPLPVGWQAEVAMRSAGGAQFAGDFVTAARTRGSTVLEVAVVDVSGKGLAAGSRALQLSGAFGGLLGALPPQGFLTAANDYLIRQEWDEGFATAVHLAICLENGQFQLRAAGHPPGAHWHAGSGRWEMLDTVGPALGLLDDCEFSALSGRMGHGDWLLLYTDGLVETRDRDVSLGIDRLIGEAEQMLTRQGSIDTDVLVNRPDMASDDRALLCIRRR